MRSELRSVVDFSIADNDVSAVGAILTLL
eukprot:SAG31_NODE_15101_length_771_cov_0.916667_1_plen_28_part_10